MIPRNLARISPLFLVLAASLCSAEPVSRTLEITGRYLLLPVTTGAAKSRLAVRVSGRLIDEFDIELAPADPQFWVFLDLADHRGKSAVITADKLPPESRGFAAIHVGDTLPGTYDEPLRPQFHFTARRGWINDPNGLLYHDGVYHLFFQHNPYGWAWGNMHWGHATSPDLVHWTQQPIAIYPHKYGDWAFSGSAIIDRDASTGFQTGEEPIIVAAYTSTARGESLAWSRDAGVTWKDYVGNPVVKHKGRDPRLLYHAPSRRWIMAVYDEFEGKRCIAFYSAPDLRLWTFESRIEGFYECPDLYELPIDGDPAKTRWVLSGADGAYLLGQFDGHAFTPDSPQKQPNNFGNCFYAAQTFSDIPPSDGRRIQMAWGRVKLPGAFNQQMLFPTELTLRTTPAGLRLCTTPVREIEKLHGTSHDRLDDLRTDLLHLKLELAVAPASQITLTLRGVPIVYDAAKAQLTCGKSTGPLKAIDGRIQLELLLDRATIELFGNGGELYMPLAVTPAPDRHDHALRLSPDASVIKCQAWELNPAWK